MWKAWQAGVRGVCTKAHELGREVVRGREEEQAEVRKERAGMAEVGRAGMTLLDRKLRTVLMFRSEQASLRRQIDIQERLIRCVANTRTHDFQLLLLYPPC